jgi:hypothetical protein
MTLTGPDPASRRIQPLPDINHSLASWPARIRISSFDREKHLHSSREILYRKLSEPPYHKLDFMMEFEMLLAHLALYKQNEEAYHGEYFMGGLPVERVGQIEADRKRTRTRAAGEVRGLEGALDKRRELAQTHKDWNSLHQTLESWIELEYSYAEYLQMIPGARGAPAREKTGARLQKELVALRARRRDALMLPQPAAGAEEGLKLEWVGELHPNGDGIALLHRSERKVYFSFRLSPASPLLSKRSVQNALAGVSYGANDISHLPIRMRAIVRNKMERVLRARAIIRAGEFAAEIPLQELQSVNVAQDATFRAGGVFGNGLEKLPEGNYSFQVDLSGDGGQTWTQSADPGSFRRVGDPEIGLPDRGKFKIPFRGIRVDPAVLSPDELQALDRSVTQRIEALSEARASYGVVVLRADDLERHPDFQEFLDRLPVRLAGAVIVWEDTVGVEPKARVEANGRRVFRGKAIELANYLAVLPEADSVVVIGDSDLARFLKNFLDPTGIAVASHPITLEGFALALGVPGSVLRQMDPATLSKDLARLRSA